MFCLGVFIHLSKERGSVRTTWYNAAKVSDKTALGSSLNTAVDLAAFKPYGLTVLTRGVTQGVRHENRTYVSARGFQHLLFLLIFGSQRAHETQFDFQRFLVTMDPLTEHRGDSFQQPLVDQLWEPYTILWMMKEGIVCQDTYRLRQVFQDTLSRHINTLSRHFARLSRHPFKTSFQDILTPSQDVISRHINTLSRRHFKTHQHPLKT